MSSSVQLIYSQIYNSTQGPLALAWIYSSEPASTAPSPSDRALSVSVSMLLRV
eukprot:gene24547-10157_t